MLRGALSQFWAPISLEMGEFFQLCVPISLQTGIHFEIPLPLCISILLVRTVRAILCALRLGRASRCDD